MSAKCPAVIPHVQPVAWRLQVNALIEQAFAADTGFVLINALLGWNCLVRIFENGAFDWSA